MAHGSGHGSGLPHLEIALASAPTDDLLKTPLHGLHLALGARMVPFAGYSMPVQYPAGILAEHRQCRHEAALFEGIEYVTRQRRQ